MAQRDPVKQARDEYLLHWYRHQKEQDLFQAKRKRFKHYKEIVSYLLGGVVLVLGIISIPGLVSQGGPEPINGDVLGAMAAVFSGSIIIVFSGGLSGSDDDDDKGLPPLSSGDVGSDATGGRDD